MRKYYSLTPHTADIAMVVEADSLENIYFNSARALADILVGIDNVSESIKREMTIKAVDRDDLLIRFLNELIYVFSVDKVIFSDFNIIKLNDRELICMAKGDRIGALNRIKREIKAATYCDFKIEENRGSYKAKVILDV